MNSDSLWESIVSSAPPHDFDSKPSLPSLESVVSSLPQGLSSPSTPDTLPGVLSFLSSTTVLGLDISLTSTGVYIYSPSVEVSTVLPPIPQPSTDFDSQHVEVYQRRTLSNLLVDLLSQHVPSLYFDHIVVEDVFIGRSTSVSRTLYSLNTAVDELLYDRVLSTSNFHRVNNVSWKSSWANLVGPSFVNHLPAKERVNAFLSMAPFDSDSCLDHLTKLNPSPKGIQDRLDAFSLAVHPLLPREFTSKGKLPPVSRVSFAYSDTLEDLFDQLLSTLGDQKTHFYEGPPKMKSIRGCLRDLPDHIIITSRPLIWGTDLDLPVDSRMKPLYTGFWLTDLSRSFLPE